MEKVPGLMIIQGGKSPSSQKSRDQSEIYETFREDQKAHDNNERDERLRRASPNHPVFGKANIADDIRATINSKLTVQPINDPVNHPNHYTSHPSGVEAIQITRHHNFAIGSAIKYLWRAGLKGGDTDKHVEDLRKAVFYINDEIGRLQDARNG